MDFTDYSTMSTTTVDGLDNMTYTELETLKSQLDTFRHRILALQNRQSPLFRLPGELRNKIFLFAMYGELLHRKQNLSSRNLYKEPALFSVSRQVKSECTGVWFNDILAWEEFDATKGVWRRLGMEEIRGVCEVRSGVKVVTKLAHCDLGRTREGVEGSRSICEKKGLVRVQNAEGWGLALLRWWVW